MGRNPAVPRRTVHVAGCPVQTTVTARPAVARRWLYTTLWRQRRRLYSSSCGGLTVGLGVQWTPPPYRSRFPAGAEPRPSTLQLCCGNRCLVFQLARAGAAPQILRRFLADGRVTFAGYYVASDCRKLRAHHGLEVESTLELCGVAGSTSRRASMADMAEMLLGIRHGVEKSMAAGRSRWDGPRLSRKQVRYAVVDAYLSCRLGVHLRRRAAAVMAFEEAEYYSDGDGDDDDVRSTASEEEESEAEYEYRRDWDRCVGFVGENRHDDDWDEAAVDDHLYDSVFACVLSSTDGEPSTTSPWC